MNHVFLSPISRLNWSVFLTVSFFLPRTYHMISIHQWRQPIKTSCLLWNHAGVPCCAPGDTQAIPRSNIRCFLCTRASALSDTDTTDSSFTQHIPYLTPYKTHFCFQKMLQKITLRLIRSRVSIGSLVSRVLVLQWPLN